MQIPLNKYFKGVIVQLAQLVLFVQVEQNENAGKLQFILQRLFDKSITYPVGQLVIH
jgi:hypothetical protein